MSQPEPIFDTTSTALYNETVVRQIADAAAAKAAKLAAEQAVAQFMAYMSGTEKLDSSIDTGKTSSDQNDGGIDMSSRIKARVTLNGQTLWVCGDSAQKLVENALRMVTAHRMGDTVKFADYADKYLNTYKKNGSVQQNTLVGYRSYMKNHLLPYFGEKLISEITVHDIQCYINEKSQSLTAKTIKEHLNLLRPIFDAAVEDELIDKNPCSSSRITIVGQKSKKVLAYTEHEFKQMEQLLPHLCGSAQLFLALSIYTGMRQGEQFALRWENIDLDTNELKVTQSVAWPSQNQGIIKEPKTENGKRTIVIIPQLAAILKQHVKQSGFVLTSAHDNTDKPMTQQAVKCLRQKIQDVATAHGVPVTFLSHRARHTVATFMNNAGADDVSITGIIGHSDVAFTKRQYANTQTDQLKRGMDRFSDFVTHITA